jgi:hypothetical protein
MPNVLEVARFAMGKIGWLKSVKSGGWAGSQAVVAGALVQLGVQTELALVLGAAIVAGANTAWQYIRKYEVVEK